MAQNNPSRQELEDVINACNVLKYRLGQVGLWRTFQKMDLVTKEVGWEMAEILQGKHTTKLAQQAGTNPQP